MKVYQCDNDNCKHTTVSIQDDWLTIGSGGNSLFIHNNLKDRKLMELNNYHDIHFCSRDCFTNAFFKKANQSK